VPEIAEIISLSAWVDSHTTSGEALMLAPDAATSYATAIKKRHPRFIIVGPEGGFTAQELDEAERRGVTLVSFGSRILRAETAALAALSVIVANEDDAPPT
jgi:16S rRNA (uracil1498-N3)-methyltransferase